MAWLMVSLAAVSNAAMDLGRVGSVVTATFDDDGEGDTLWFEYKLAFKFESSFSKDLIQSTISEDDCSSLRAAWLCLLAAGHQLGGRCLQRDDLKCNLHTSCAIGNSSLQCSPVVASILCVHQTHYASLFNSRFLD